MSAPILTIAIPTFDRNDTLGANIAPLLEQLRAPGNREKCRLLVIDNASPTPVEQTLRAQFGELDFEVERNAVNIGANANILRCFEKCQTPWLWVLGDDDRVVESAVETALRSIEAHPDHLFLNFSSNLWERETEVSSRGLEGFLASMDSLWAVLFISSSLYHADKLKSGLRVGYRYEYSHAPQLVTLLSCLGKDGQCLLGCETLVAWHQPDETQQWPVLNFALAIPTILELPMSDRARRSLAGKIVGATYLELLVMQLLLLARETRSSQSALFLFDQLCFRLFYFDRSPRRRLKTFAYRLLLRAPRTSLRVMSLLKRGKKKSAPAVQNRFERI